MSLDTLGRVCFGRLCCREGARTRQDMRRLMRVSLKASKRRVESWCGTLLKDTTSGLPLVVASPRSDDPRAAGETLAYILPLPR